MSRVFVHPSAIVETSDIGNGTRVWAYSHVLEGARIGENCNVCDHGFIESGAVIGNNVTLKNHVCVWDGITIEDNVFVGPYVAFTNDLYPRSRRMLEVRERYENKENWLVRTLIEEGTTIGSNATIVCGVQIGRFSFVAAGAIVTTNVEPFSLMIGAPAKNCGYVCRCGRRQDILLPEGRCDQCETNTENFQQQFAQKS